jgi:molybdate/tungstate transport system substrate-binding protein
MLASLAGCGPAQTPLPTQAPAPTEVPQEPTLEGKLIIFHAGSLTVPVNELTKAFQAKHPGVTFETEAGGSNATARKISELGREADLMMSADYTVIDKLLIPDFADWNVQFARNTMVIAYTDQSQYADEITVDNWYEIFAREGVIYGHSAPDADPCGYRTLLVWQLAEAHYGVGGLYDKLQDHCPKENVRPKSVELIALLESGDMDYAWEYRSVAVQHGLKFIELPDEINLSMVEHVGFYSQASVEIAGSEPGTTMTMTGAPIVYGVTIPKNAPSPELAVEFVKFLLGPEGQAIMEAQGQPPIVPATTGDMDAVPSELKELITEVKAPEPAADVALSITGAVDNELALSMADLEALGVEETTVEHLKKGAQRSMRASASAWITSALPASSPSS